MSYTPVPNVCNSTEGIHGLGNCVKSPTEEEGRAAGEGASGNLSGSQRSQNMDTGMKKAVRTGAECPQVACVTRGAQTLCERGREPRAAHRPRSCLQYKCCHSIYLLPLPRSLRHLHYWAPHLSRSCKHNYLSETAILPRTTHSSFTAEVLDLGFSWTKSEGQASGQESRAGA